MIAPVIQVMLLAAAVCTALAIAILLVDLLLRALGFDGLDFLDSGYFLTGVAVAFIVACALTGAVFGLLGVP